MPNIAVVLKQEIRRLARKEVRSVHASTATVVAQLRKSNAALRRQLAELARQVTLLRRGSRQRAATAEPASQEAATQHRFSAKGVASLRRRLDLSAAQFARLAGVSAQSVYLWERGQRPRPRQLEALAQVRKLSPAGARAELAKLTTQKSPAKKRRATARRKSRARR